MDTAQSLRTGGLLIGRVVGGRGDVRHMAGDAVELVMCIGVRKYIGLDGMAVLTGLADDGLIDNGHPGDAVKTSRIVTGVAAHALLSMDAHEVLIGFFMVCLAGELGLLVFGQIGLGILSDTERSHELRFFGDVDLINVVRTFCGTGGRKTDRCQAGES